MNLENENNFSKVILTIFFITILLLGLFYLNKKYNFLSIKNTNNTVQKDNPKPVPEKDTRTPSQQLADAKKYGKIEFPKESSVSDGQLKDLPKVFEKILVGSNNVLVKKVSYSSGSRGFSITYDVKNTAENTYRPIIKILRDAKISILSAIFMDSASIIDFDDGVYKVSMEFKEEVSGFTSVSAKIIKK